jgi:hypothetical protein
MGGIAYVYVVMFDWTALGPPKRPPPGQLAYTFVILIHRRLAPKYQHYLYAVTLGIYLGGYEGVCAEKHVAKEN